MTSSATRTSRSRRRRFGWNAAAGAATMAMACSTVAAQATWYVATQSQGGADTQSGAAGAPFATVQRAVAAVHAGDTVLIGAGTFAGFNIGGGATAEGVPGAPITFRGTRGPAGEWLTIVDTEAPRFNGTTHHARINIDTASWITLEDLEVVGVHDQRFSKAGIRAVMPDDGSDGHITVRRCHIHDNGEWGVFTGHVHHVTVEDCLIHHQVDEHGVYLSNSGDGHIVRRNIIHSNSSNGIHINSDASQGGDGVITDVLVEANTIYNNGGGSTYIDGAGVSRTSIGGGSGINCDGVRDSRIVNNVLYDNHASGISLYRIDGLLGAANNTVVNNTIINAANARWCLNITDGSTGNTVFNNILLNYHPSRGSITISADSLPGLVSDHNIVMDRLDPGTGVAQSLAQWRASTGQDQHSVVSPTGSWASLFVDLVIWNLHVSATSAARNAGTAALNARQAPTADRDGRIRPAPDGLTIVDIGAYEFAPAMSCPADFNSSGSVTVQDIFDFLAAYFASDPRAEFNGVGGVTLQDIFDFLAAYFVPCP